MVQAPLRKTECLDGFWSFRYFGSVEADSVTLNSFTYAPGMLVPSAFDALPQYAGQRGVAAYQRTISLPAGQVGRLKFGAVSMWSRIYVDGELLMEHSCGYAPFCVYVPAADVSERVLTVVVDNRYDFNRVPMHEEYFDFYQYGGILRSVTLETLPSTSAWIDYVHVLPTAAGYCDGEVEVRVAFGGTVESGAAIELSFDGESIPVPTENDSASGMRQFVVKVPRPQLWSPEAPHLHRARIGLVGADAVEVRFGLRWIEARDAALWLNGEKLQLRGYNRHEYHPSFGPCTPVAQMYVDLQLMRGMGCNFIRGSHYPQDQKLLDLCDELGFLFWEENLGWGQREKTFASEKFVRDHAYSLRNMVIASANHPSIIIWGFLNEAGTNQDYPRAVIEESVAILRDMDPTRLISFATMFALEDKYYDLIDLISLNIYPGWYGCPGKPDPLGMVEPHWLKCFASIDERGFADKPVIISETGVEALYGWREPHNDFFSEEYQAAYLRKVCEIATTHPRCSGIALWHFSDARTYGGGYSLGRPRTFNNKGTFDEYRRPKLSYQAVKEVFTDAASKLSQF